VATDGPIGNLNDPSSPREWTDMSISAIGSGQSTSAQQVQKAQHHGHGQSGVRKAGMDAAAQALGLSSTDLRSALKSGQSLSALAQSKGVSTDTLAAAISGAVAKANPSLSSARAQQIAQRMIEGPGTAGSVGGAGGDQDHDGDSH
jgi:hypothetical protein